MPSLTVAFDASGGPVVAIEVGMNAAQDAVHRAYGAPVPDPIRLLALVDTGCSTTLIEERHLKRLDLETVGPGRLVTASSEAGEVAMALYAVDLFLADQPAPIATDLVVGARGSLEGPGVAMLLGRDVLRGGRLSYDGEKNQLTSILKEATRP